MVQFVQFVRNDCGAVHTELTTNVVHHMFKYDFSVTCTEHNVAKHSDIVLSG